MEETTRSEQNRGGTGDTMDCTERSERRVSKKQKGAETYLKRVPRSTALQYGPHADKQEQEQNRVGSAVTGRTCPCCVGHKWTSQERFLGILQSFFFFLEAAQHGFPSFTGTYSADATIDFHVEEAHLRARMA